MSKEPEFIFAARRCDGSRGSKLIELVHLRSGYIVCEREDELKQRRVKLGDFVHADMQDKLWKNYRPTKHTQPKITTTIDNDTAYINNVDSKLHRQDDTYFWKNFLFPIALCRETGLKEHSIHTVRYSLLPEDEMTTIMIDGKIRKIVFEGTLKPVEARIQAQQPAIVPPPVPPRGPSPTPTVSSTYLPPTPINRQLNLYSEVLNGTRLEPSKEHVNPVFDTDNGEKSLFWAARRYVDIYEDIIFFDCVLLGKNEVYPIIEEKLKSCNVELGDFFRASILDGEVCELEKDDPPAGWIVKPYKKNLAAITEVISEVVKLDGKSFLKNPILGISFCFENVSEGNYTHQIIISKEPMNMGDKKVILEANKLKKVHQHFKAIVLGYFEKDGIRTHDVLISGKNIKCQFTDEKIKLQKFDFFMGEFEEINGAWTCVKFGKEIKTDIEEFSEENGTVVLRVNIH